MCSKRKLAVVTSTRAEYGLFQPLLKKIIDNNFELQLIVTGTHLSHEFGYTVEQIEEDGYNVTEKIDSLISNDSESAIGKTAALTLMGIVDCFVRHDPDLIFLLGDRYETLSAAFAANICRIPIAHLHGGEITEGANDDSYRHAITKLSHLHFTSSEEHRNRVIQMGEDSDFVYNVGAIGIDNIKNIKPMSKNVLEKNLGIKFLTHNLLITVHPETLDKGSSEKNIHMLLDVLEKQKDTFLIFTGTNADSEGRIINRLFKNYCDTHTNTLFVDSLGQLRYISMLYIVNAVIGNSSSGIIEVPSFGIPTLNIGDRQKGRMSSKSIININWNSDEIKQNINDIYNNKIFSDENPYGTGETANKIIDYLQKINNFTLLLKKSFNNL